MARLPNCRQEVVKGEFVKATVPETGGKSLEEIQQFIAS
jgi:hypothetical protein